MKHLTKIISLFLLLLLTIPNTFGNTTIYEGEHLKVYNIFYNAFSDNSEKELNAKLDEADSIIKTKELLGINELVNVIKVALGNLIFEKYPKETNCNDLLGPGGKLYEYDFSGKKPFKKLENGGIVQFYNEDEMIYGFITNTKIKKGDVVSVKFRTGDCDSGLLNISSAEYVGYRSIKSLIISKYKCDISSKDNIYRTSGTSTQIYTQVGLYGKKNIITSDILERDTIYYFTLINREKNKEYIFYKDNCPEGKYCGFMFQVKNWCN